MITQKAWEFSFDGRIGTSLRQCLLAAIAAPSIHNTQPWRFRLFPGGIDVFVDHTRRLGVVDPNGREAIISVGAALLNLRIAILAHGHTPLQQLLPDPTQPDLVARVRIGPAAEPSDTVRLLADAIPRRHTIRRPFSEDRVPPEVINELVQAAAVEGGHLILADDNTRAAVLDLVRLAEHRARHDPKYWAELAEWTHPTHQHQDGVPVEAFGPWSALEAVPIRDFGLLSPARRRTVASFETDSTIGVLYTDGDGPAQWLRAGEALERTLLTACVRGVATTLMTQPIEVPSLRALLDETADGLHAHAVIRFGYGPPGVITPRRPLESVLI